MRGRPAQEQLLDRGAILREARDWAQEKGLCKRHIAAVQVPFAQIKLRFKVVWSDYLRVQHQRLQVRRELAQAR